MNGVIQRIIKTEFSALDFVDLADRDYIGARLLTFAGKPLWRLAAYHSHQAIEKYLKSLLVQAEGGYLETHKLIELAERASKYFSILKKQEYVKTLKLFDEPEQVTRYGPFANFDPLSKVEPGKFQTKDVFVWSDVFIKDLDKAVFIIRGQVDFISQENRDGLRAILEGNVKNKILAGWKLPRINMVDILISHNDFFNSKQT